MPYTFSAFLQARAFAGRGIAIVVPTNGAAENSIQIGFGAAGTVTGNTVGSDVWAPDVFGDTGDAAAGLLVYASPNVTIKSNNVSNTQFGIAIVSDPTLGVADGSDIDQQHGLTDSPLRRNRPVQQQQ